MQAKKIFYSFFIIFLVLSLTACSSTLPDVAKKDVTKEEQKSNEVHTAHWSYEGETGPEHWGDINPDYAACTNGKEQSPVNIEMSKVIEDEKIKDLDINYKPTGFSLSNNGHTIQANPQTLDNSIVVDNNEYKLAQFHFHTPSEHQFNGQNFDMELHLVHKDANNQLAVLGLMIKEGASNPYLEKAWNVIPTEETTEDVKLAESIDLMNLLPKDKDSFRYNGSLTTPPCSEAVKWIVLEEPIEMSKEQIDKFRKIFPDNHRPVQSLNEREVKEDD
ncbi:carbonic anhydrase [Peribacillus loiseleuriae]|uniref:carbonic anhydrase n=1 Tax=Peribacillus loiseleuriae TaxID=1679170 RepID=A0A0K9GSL4_9BACI|nr:carbonic anhydrase family protein [Peribacillus loiseleuriae]KMY49679.1 carbonic anhydrase [Peribacillus loiseleuriae]